MATHISKYPSTKTLKHFKDLLTTPFGVILFTEFYRDNHSGKKITKTDLIDFNINKRLNKASNPFYTKEEVMTWLGYVAKFVEIGETFRVENLSPKKVLNEKQQRQYQWWFVSLFGTVFGLMLGSVGGLMFGELTADKVIKGGIVLPEILMNIHELFHSWHSKYPDIRLILSYAGIGILCSLLMSHLVFLIFKRINFALFLGGYLALFLSTTGLLFHLNIQWSLSGFLLFGILGILLGSNISNNNINPLEIELNKRFNYNDKDIKNYLTILFQALALFPILTIITMFFASFLNLIPISTMLMWNGLAIYLGFVLIYLMYLAREDFRWKKQDFLPSQKIKSVLIYNGLVILIFGGTITLLVTGVSAIYLDWPGNLSLGLRIGIPMGIASSFILYGGADILKHLALRIIIYKYGMTPLDYIKFLEYCKQLTLLKQQNDGYAFEHDWFQEYFRVL